MQGIVVSAAGFKTLYLFYIDGEVFTITDTQWVLLGFLPLFSHCGGIRRSGKEGASDKIQTSNLWIQFPALYPLEIR